MIRRYTVTALEAKGNVNRGVMIQTVCEELIAVFSFESMREETRWDHVSYTLDNKMDIPKRAKKRGKYYYSFGH